MKKYSYFSAPFQEGPDYILSIIYNTNHRLVDELHPPKKTTKKNIFFLALLFFFVIFFVKPLLAKANFFNVLVFFFLS